MPIYEKKVTALIGMLMLFNAWKLP